MSFSVPRNVPSLDKRAQDALYKDKPFGHNYRQGVSSAGKQRRRTGLILSALFIAVLYFVYQFGRGHKLSTKESSEAVSWPERQDAVRDAFKRSWTGYKKYAWGMDEYKPISKWGRNMGPKPLGWIIVDSLDTMKIMGLDHEFKEARNWVAKELDYDMDYEVNTFETSIRMLGGLLSAYYLSGDKMFLEKATDLGERLSGAFDSKSGIPYASVNLHTGRGKPSHTDQGASSTAEAATVQLEFKYLAHLTGKEEYWTMAERVFEVIDSNKVPHGLVPIYINPELGRFQGSIIRLGSRGDSYYEYLIKQYIQTGEPVYKEMYDEAVEGIKDRLLDYSVPGKLTYIAELNHGINGPLSPKMDHLVCFAGGMLALGATRGHELSKARKMQWTTSQEADFQLGREIARTCYEMYARTPTGLAAEIVFFNTDKDVSEDFRIKTFDAHNLQRPETVESLFVLWRLTHNPIYREWGWKIFEAFEKYTKLEGDAGYTSLDNVKEVPPPKRDNMESFWLSETLKYLYLLFDDDEDVLPLTEVVFNTEAHPFPVLKETKFSTGWSRANDRS
ncbi:endoplasmic reticulum mannosyl-oligosaccharide 1,2-alpha-mannosidase [Trichomonascus vanleenenianus]|uniref:glycoside hydrolase family 47 protein n=1 Tax=Trichomonascus vanleenenianus TaxID=2268995 RepID=UPI003EC9BECD